MNILFLTILRIDDISERGLYNDLIRKFIENRHSVFVACPSERRHSEKTSVAVGSGFKVLKIRTLNLQKTNIVEKGIGTLLLERQFLQAIKRHYSDVKFDLVLYSTPPITFTRIIRFIKNRDQAKSYLLLKDIFPQNAVDLGMLKANGILHKIFTKKERALYACSDYIGCMSPANVEFVTRNHKEIDPDTVEVNPNSIEPISRLISEDEKSRIRSNYNIPLNAVLFIYGGNLGKPQGIDFLIEVLNSNSNMNDRFFLIVGSGTEFNKLENWFRNNKPSNATLFESLPKSRYDELLQSCDIGLIFLDKRFTIPNFPSRLLSYMECKMPVLAATDTSTDIGKIIKDNQFGYWCENGDLSSFNEKLNLLSGDKEMRAIFGRNSYNYLLNHYLTSHSYKKIIDHFDV